MSCIITCANPLEYKQIRFGVLKKDCSQHYLINNLFELAKYFIHKYRFLKTPPSFPYFVNELKAFATSLGTLSDFQRIKYSIAFCYPFAKKNKKICLNVFYKGLFCFCLFLFKTLLLLHIII